MLNFIHYIMKFKMWATVFPQPSRSSLRSTQHPLQAVLSSIYAVQQDTQGVLMSEFIHHVC